MPPCGTQDDENMMVLWRRSLYWSSSSVAVLAALVVLVIFERRASPYPLHLGRGSLFVSGARFSEQWIKRTGHVDPFHSKNASKEANKGAKGAKSSWLALLEASFPLGSELRDSSVRPPDGLAASWLTKKYLGQVVRSPAELAAS